MYFTPFTVGVVAILGWVAVTWIRAHYGVPGPFRKSRWDHNQGNLHVPPMFQKLLDKAMSERDAEIHALRERVEVLEKIVTDGHKSTTLADEIERLRS